jgi:hypothetical protein
MIIFGSAMTDPEAYRRYARPGIGLAAEPNSEVYAFAAVGSICRSYNLLLERAAAQQDLEALVLVHQEVEIVDSHFCRSARQALSDPAVGAVGCMGATGVRSIAWWEGSISSASIVLRHQQYGGGDVRAFSWKPLRSAPAEVETLDGSLLVLSPWAVRNLRFDESLALGHGYDFDFCLRLRSAGHKLTTADLRVVRHQPKLDLINDLDLWIEAHIMTAQKWDGRLPGAPARESNWKERARRAEAEREAARAIAYSTGHQVEAQLRPLQGALEAMHESLSWRITAPLRRVNRWRRRLRSRVAAPERGDTAPS